MSVTRIPFSSFGQEFIVLAAGHNCPSHTYDHTVNSDFAAARLALAIGTLADVKGLAHISMANSNGDIIATGSTTTEFATAVQSALLEDVEETLPEGTALTPDDHAEAIENHPLSSFYESLAALSHELSGERTAIIGYGVPKGPTHTWKPTQSGHCEWLVLTKDGITGFDVDENAAHSLKEAVESASMGTTPANLQFMFGRASVVTRNFDPEDIANTLRDMIIDDLPENIQEKVRDDFDRWDESDHPLFKAHNLHGLFEDLSAMANDLENGMDYSA